MNEGKITMPARFSDPAGEVRCVVQSVYDALLNQMMSVGFVEMNEEGFTERITFESGDVRHIWDDDAIPAASIKPLRAILRGLSRTSAD